MHETLNGEIGVSAGVFEMPGRKICHMCPHLSRERHATSDKKPLIWMNYVIRDGNRHWWLWTEKKRVKKRVWIIGKLNNAKIKKKEKKWLWNEILEPTKPYIWIFFPSRVKWKLKERGEKRIRNKREICNYFVFSWALLKKKTLSRARCTV